MGWGCLGEEKWPVVPPNGSLSTVEWLGDMDHQLNPQRTGVMPVILYEVGWWEVQVYTVLESDPEDCQVVV